MTNHPNRSLAASVRRLTSERDALRTAAERAIQIIDTNLYHQREKVKDAATLLRQALAAK